MIDRRAFIRRSTVAAIALATSIKAFASDARRDAEIMAVTGPIPGEKAGNMLIHEHLLVDFAGAEQTGYHRWDRAEVVEKVMPYLLEAKALGCDTLADCTPAFLGRDPWLLKTLSEKSGMNIVTNTGLYGARDNKFIPGFAFDESAEQLASRWIGEFRKGIEGSGVRPGFIKIGVNRGLLSDFHRRLITAAAITHEKTGMVIASHTGPAIAAMEQLDVLASMNVDPSAFIWVHAKNEKDYGMLKSAAEKGAWISFDGIRAENVADTVPRVMFMKNQGLLHRTLVSHDAGWYDPGQPEGGDFAPFTTIYTKLIPLLKQEGLDGADVKQLFEKNPLEAFALR